MCCAQRTLEWMSGNHVKAGEWQRHASATVHDHYREQVVWPQLCLAERALVRSQSVPLASVPFTALPIHRISRMDPEPFRVLLLRRLRMPLPLNVRACRCGRLLDVLGHHRAACSRVGELGKRGFAAEGAVAQICREGGARVSTNVMLRDLDISPPHSSDGRRLEVVAEGLCLFCGCQLALDATVVSTLHGDGTHRRMADVEDGVALKEARRSKETTYPELCRGDGRARLVVIAGEVGGRWSQETKDFLWCLACEKSKSSPRLLQGSVRVGWYRRWCCLLACSTAKAVACSLAGHRGSLVSDTNEDRGVKNLEFVLQKMPTALMALTNYEANDIVANSRSDLSRQAKEKGHQVRVMGVFKCGGAHFQRDCNTSKNTGKQLSGKGKQSKSWSKSEGKGKSKENTGKSKGQSKGSKGAKGSCKGETSKTGISGFENLKSETSSETQNPAQLGRACTTDTSWIHREWSPDEWNDG